MAQFDSKIFNPEVFGQYVKTIPDTTRNMLITSGAIVTNQDIADLFPAQTGGYYQTRPYYGLLDGEPGNYDGVSDIESTSQETYSQSMIVIGRHKGFKEKDFSKEITGKDFMTKVAEGIVKYWTGVDQTTLLSILKGIFSMSNASFVASHTYDISGQAGENAKFGETTINTATQQACGDNKNAFSLAIMHSLVATNMENLNLLERLKYTDAYGIQRDLTLGTINGKLVLIDDGMPVDLATGKYTTYVLGNGAFEYSDCGAKVPYEMVRDAHTNGGVDELITRQRKVFAPAGISFTKAELETLSPTKAELETGANWEIVNNGKTSTAKKEIDHKAIPIVRIITKENTVTPSI